MEEGAYTPFRLSTANLLVIARPRLGRLTHEGRV